MDQQLNFKIINLTWNELSPIRGSDILLTSFLTRLLSILT